MILSMDNLVLKEITLNKERTTIGRKPGNDIHIDNLAVSGEHAVIFTILNDSFLEDLGSTNGTLVNGNMVKKHFLQNNDVIELGKYKLKYVNEQPSQVTSGDYEKTMVIHPKPTPKAAEGVSQNLQTTQPMRAHPLDTIPGSAFAAKPAAELKPVEHKPVVAEAKPAAEAKTAAEVKPSAEMKPAAEAKSEEEMKLAGEVKLAVEAKSAEAKPSAEAKLKPKPAETKPQAATTEPKPSSAAAAKPGLLAAIQILTGPSAGKELDLTKSLTTLGKPGVQVVVVTRRPQGYFMTHVEGATFPLLNGKTLDAQAHALNDHDIIELGGIKMEFFYKVA